MTKETERIVFMGRKEFFFAMSGLIHLNRFEIGRWQMATTIV